MGSTKSPFSHITVDSLASEDVSQEGGPAKDDDEVIEVGYPSGSNKSTPNARLGSRSSVDEGVEVDADAATSGSSRMTAPVEDVPLPDASASEVPVSPGPTSDDDLPDYSVDDLDAMPLTQKIVIAVLVICLVFAALYILDYYGVVDIWLLHNLSLPTSL